jgi:multiple antibiotic resistance protein
MELFIYLFASLFSVLNPIGTVPIFVGLTQDYDKKERAKVALWTAIDVFLILIISYFVGQYVLSFFGITINALRIAGGIIIANSGFSLLNKKFNKSRGITKETGR